MPTLRQLLATTFALLLLALAGTAAAQQAIPALTARVIDATGTLLEPERQALEDKLAAFEQRHGAQVVVLMVPTVQPEDIADFTQRVGDAWKIGRKGIGDGLLIVVAKNDRKVRIAPAKTLEGAVPDLAAKQIIDEAITPRFKQNDFAGGLDQAIDRLTARIGGENLPAPVEIGNARSAGGLGGALGFDWEDLAIFLFVAVPLGVRLLSGLLGRKLGALLTGGAIGVVAWFFTASVVLTGIAFVIAFVFALFMSLLKFNPGGGGGSSGWGSGGGGWSGGSGGGGGFSSGGGGDFGGGGASGDW